MPRLSEMPKGDAMAFLIYGGAGKGKTEFCGSCGSRTLLINTGLGILTLQSPEFKKRWKSDPIVETIIEETLPDKATGHHQVCDILDNYLNPEHPQFNDFDVVCVDDATALRRMAMSLALEINGDLEKSKSTAAIKKYQQKIVAVQDYGQEMDIVDTFLIDYISLCKKLGKHFILTAHERYEFGKPPGIGQPAPLIKTKPGFTGRTFPDSVQGHFDFTWHMETMGGGTAMKFYARTVGDSSMDAKSRIGGVFPVMWENPNWPATLQKIKG